MVMNNPIVEVDGLHRVFISFFYSAFKILGSQDKKVEADEKGRSRYSFTAVCYFKQVLSPSNRNYFHL